MSTTTTTTSVPLGKTEWFKGIYKKIYEILADRLPPASEIFLSEPPVKPGDTVYGMAWRGADGRWHVWFRELPPSPVVFAHELIHCAVKQRASLEEEEVFAYNLSGFIALLAKREIKPPASPLLLFETHITPEELLELLNEFYARFNTKFSSLGEYFAFRGVVPTLFEMRGLRVVVKEGAPPRAIVLSSLSEILAAAEYEELSMRLVLYLLSRLPRLLLHRHS